MKNLYRSLLALSVRSDLALRGACRKLKEKRGDFVMDHAAVFLIILVVAGVVLGLLLTYFRTDFADALKTKINQLFAMS